MADETTGRAARWTLQIAIFVRRHLWEKIAVRSVLPKQQRDLRLDLFRGLVDAGNQKDTWRAWRPVRTDQDKEGGRRAAAMHTLIATAKLNDIDPQAWLADVLARLPDHPARRIHELLPWNWRPQSVAHPA